MTAFILAKYRYYPQDFVKGLFAALSKNDLYYEFLASGTGSSMLVSLDRIEQKTVKGITGTKTFKEWASGLSEQEMQERGLFKEVINQDVLKAIVDSTQRSKSVVGVKDTYTKKEIYKELKALEAGR